MCPCQAWAGFEAASRILAESPASKVVTLSMHSEKRFVDDMLKAGAAAYVLKDSAPEDLVVAIRAALRGECFLSPPILETVVSGYRESVEGAPRPPFILQTKLHRPPLPPDLVVRTPVLERLDAGRDQPLTLVSAPAGYGKSLLIASWVARGNQPSAWLCLDADDSEVTQFLAYLVATVRRVFPDACEETLLLATAPHPPPTAALAATLSNELDAITDSMVLVLDDYHNIASASPVNELLQQLLARPPGRLHVVLITRRDPPIPLALLRARGQVNEIRMRDLPVRRGRGPGAAGGFCPGATHRRGAGARRTGGRGVGGGPAAGRPLAAQCGGRECAAPAPSGRRAARATVP